MDNAVDYFVSEITGKSYHTSDVVRIINMQQLASYLLHGAELLDIYPSRDFETGKPIMVGIVDRKKTYELYDLWCKRELQ